MNDLSIMAKFQSRGNLKGPVNHLFYFELLLKASFPENLVPEISIGAMLHHQVVVVTLHFMIEIAKSFIETESENPHLPHNMNVSETRKKSELLENLFTPLFIKTRNFDTLYKASNTVYTTKLNFLNPFLDNNLFFILFSLSQVNRSKTTSTKTLDN